MKQLTKYLLAILVLIVVGCKSESPVEPVIGWQGEYNSTGYPVVEGKYSFRTSMVDVDCDGQDDQIDGITKDLFVIQKDDSLTLVSVQDNELPNGWEIVSTTDMKGLVDKKGNFDTHQKLVVNVQEYVDDLVVHYYISGSFTTEGWNGKYESMVTNSTSYCSYKSTFKGEKTGSLGKITDLTSLILPITIKNMK